MLFARDVIIGCKDTKAIWMKRLNRVTYQKKISHKGAKAQSEVAAQLWAWHRSSETQKRKSIVFICAICGKKNSGEN